MASMLRCPMRNYEPLASTHARIRKKRQTRKQLTSCRNYQKCYVRRYNIVNDCTERFMIKKLTPIGHSLGIILDRPVLDLLNINRDTKLTVTTDGDALILRPVRPHVTTMQPVRGRPGHSRVSRTTRSFDLKQVSTMPTLAPNEAERE